MPHDLTVIPAMHLDDPNTLCLKAVVQLQADALICVLQPFQDRNVVPRRVTAQRIPLRTTGHDVLHIEIEFDITDLTMDALRLLATKVAQLPVTLSTVFARPGESGTQ